MMTDTTCTAPRCAVPLNNGYTLCTAHTETLRTNLQAVSDVWANLQVTIRKQDATAANVGGTGPTGSKPAMNLDAWDKGQTLESVLKGWGGELWATEYPIKPFTDKGWSGYLLENLDTVAHQDWAGDLYRELADSLHECRLVTDRATERINLGVCGLLGCDGTVTAIVGDKLARCRKCGGYSDVKERQRNMIIDAWHITAYLPDIVEWLHESKHANLNLKKVEKWVYDGKLEPQSRDRVTGRPLYTPAAVMKRYLETPTGKKESKKDPVST